MQRETLRLPSSAQHNRNKHNTAQLAQQNWKKSQHN